MALRGPQWKNTFWNEQDDEGNDTVQSLNKDARHRSMPTKEFEGSDQYGGSQGMLFSPFTATGGRQDPLIPLERRHAAIEKAYQLSNSEEDMKRQAAVESDLGSGWEGRKELGKRALETNRKLAIQSIDLSHVPTHMIEDQSLYHPSVVATDRSVGRRNSGTYWAMIHGVGIKNIVEEKKTHTMVRRATAGSELVTNPKPLQVQDKGGITYDIPGFTSVNWNTPEDEVAAMRHPKFPDVGIEHIFTSPGDPAKFVSSEIPDGRGGFEGAQYGRNQSGKYINKRQTFYTRRAATEWEAEPTLRVTKTEKSRLAPPDAAAHELGHAYHLRGKNADLRSNGSSGGADPLNEGVADGFEDHYFNHRGTHVDDLTGVSDTDRFETTRSGMQILGKGYRSTYRGWGDDSQRALYAAMRHHVAVTGQVPSSTERKDVVESLGGEAPEVPDKPRMPKTVYLGISPEEAAQKEAADTAAWEAENAEALEAHRKGRAAHDEWVGRSGADNPNRMALGRLLYEHQHVRDLMGASTSNDHVKAMQVEADTALSEYKRRLDAAGGGNVDPTDPVHGWKASPARVRRHNEAVQSMTLPLVDPETGSQYDNRIHSDDPVFPAGRRPKFSGD